MDVVISVGASRYDSGFSGNQKIKKGEIEVKKTKPTATCYACDRDSEAGVWINGGDWTFYCVECYERCEKLIPSWEHAEKIYWPTEKNG